MSTIESSQSEKLESICQLILYDVGWHKWCTCGGGSWISATEEEAEEGFVDPSLLKQLQKELRSMEEKRGQLSEVHSSVKVR